MAKWWFRVRDMPEVRALGLGGAQDLCMHYAAQLAGHASAALMATVHQNTSSKAGFSAKNSCNLPAVIGPAVTFAG
jgi:hypothetical protein